MKGLVHKYHFTLVCLVVVGSGNQIVNLLGQKLFYISLFILLLVNFFYGEKKLNKKDLHFLYFFISLFFIHVIFFKTLVVMASIGYLIKFLVALLVVRVVPNFFTLYIKAIAYICLISLLFYIPTLLGIELQNYLSFMKLPITDDNIIHIGIHNFHRPIETRNSGMFWEPGAFAGYIILALLFSVLFKIKLSMNYLWILGITLITTQSTTGYIAFIPILFNWFYFKSEKKYNLPVSVSKILITPAAVIVLLIVFEKIDFLGDKINKQLIFTEQKSGHYEITRFGNILFDISDIIKRPIFGWGANPESRYYVNPRLESLITGQGVGVTGFIVKFGLVAYCFICFIICLNAKKINNSRREAFLTLIVINIILIGEQFVNYPLFYVLVFMKKKKIRSGQSSITHAAIK